MTLTLLIGLAACDGRPERRETTVHPAAPICGDGRIQEGERCDGAAVGSSTCEAAGFRAGTLGCRTDCAATDTSFCGAPASCGNEAVQAPELCDGSDLGGATCASLGYGAGTLGCRASCGGFDTSACGPPTTCGDGARSGVEACDGVAFGGLTCERLGLGTGALGCAANCLSVVTSGCRTITDAGTSPQGDATTDACAGVTCSGHGTCALAGGQPLCVCELGYEPSGLTCAAHVNGAPTITSAQATSAITEGQSVVLDAVVADPDGLGDIGGGRVEDTQGARLAIFTQVSPGQYEASVTWAGLHAAMPIEFVGETFRTLVVVFFDVGGNETRTQVQVRLHCGGTANGACGGACTALDTIDRCGACNLGCNFTDPVRGWSGQCISGECSFEAALPDGTGATQCLAGCANLFANAACAGATGSTYLLSFIGAIPSVSCSQTLESIYPTQVTLTDLNCECRSTAGQYRTLAKPRNTTCTTLCSTTYGDPCFLLHFTGTVPSGQSVFGADNCQSPYNRASWDGTGIGDVVPYQDALDTLRCDCRVPPR